MPLGREAVPRLQQRRLEDLEHLLERESQLPRGRRRRTGRRREPRSQLERAHERVHAVRRRHRLLQQREGARRVASAQHQRRAESHRGRVPRVLRRQGRLILAAKAVPLQQSHRVHLLRRCR